MKKHSDTHNADWSIGRAFAPILAGLPVVDSEFVLRMEEAQLAATGRNPDIRDAMHRLRLSLLNLFEKVGSIHFMQLAVDREMKEGVPILDTLNELNACLQLELDMATSEQQAWDADRQERYDVVAPIIFAASELLGELRQKIDRLQARIGSANADRLRAEEKYHAAGLTAEQISSLQIKPTVEDAEDWRAEVSSHQSKTLLLESFLSDAPRYRLEKLGGVELPALEAHRTQYAHQKQVLEEALSTNKNWQA